MPDTNAELTEQHVYHCINRRCRRYHVEFRSLSPRAYRVATGRPNVCPACGDVARWLRRDAVPRP